MTVIVICEECHGDIGIAKDFEHAIDFLIHKDWLNNFTDIYKDGEWRAVKDIFGSGWERIIKNMNIDSFNESFEDRFLLGEVKVYGT